MWETALAQSSVLLCSSEVCVLYVIVECQLMYGVENSSAMGISRQ